MVPSRAPFFCSCHNPHPTCHHLLVSCHNQKRKRIFAKNTESITGIPCPNCMRTPMLREYGKWECPGCHLSSPDAHKKVIIDHLLLQQTITNRECRALLGVESKHLAKRILVAMDLPYKGEGKNRVYYLDVKKVDSILFDS